MADTPQGETATPGAPENNTNNHSTPVAAPAAPVKTEETSEIDRLRKELEQKTMRENQLANQLKAKEDAEDKAKAAEMEEQNQFKSLYEQEKAKNEAIEADREEAERTAELQKVRTDVLAEYSEEVRALAEDVGVNLTDTDDSAVKSFKEKLDKINTRVASTGSVGANNRQENNEKPELSGDELKVALRDEQSFHELMMDRYPGIAAMTSKRQ